MVIVGSPDEERRKKAKKGISAGPGEGTTCSQSWEGGKSDPVLDCMRRGRGSGMGKKRD